MDAPWIIWGSELSPFTLKVVRLFRHAGLPFRLLPAEGTWRENWRALLRVERVKRGWLPLTYPEMTADDEFPLVPFVLGPDGTNLYDSTAIALWLDKQRMPGQRFLPLDPTALFIARLIDDYADEFGLYLVHHNRWVLSAKDNDAGARLAREYRTFFPGALQSVFERRFSARQTRRLPYLFSVAPEGFHIEGLPPERQPPSRAGFPPTHELLNEAYLRLITVLDALLRQRPYILGTRFTLADAALYGQLAMNLADPSADALLRARAPTLHRWLTALHGTAAVPQEGRLAVDDTLMPLFAEIARTHVPLMRQNAQAYERLRQQGEWRFNERAFDRDACLYDGTLDGRPFRSVVKSFQARVWRDNCARYRWLGPHEQYQLSLWLPGAYFT